MKNNENIKKTEWWAEGVRFQCQGSGNCCISRDEYGFVFLTLSDRKRFAKYFGITIQAFTKKYCTKRAGLFHLTEIKTDPNCMFLKDKKCSVYQARPTQCRTWPFWPEVMNAKTWQKEVSSFCPGIGKGPLISAEKIKASIEEQKKSENELLKEIK